MSAPQSSKQISDEYGLWSESIWLKLPSLGFGPSMAFAGEIEKFLVRAQDHSRGLIRGKSRCSKG